MLEVASKVFPDPDKPLVSSGVLLAELTKSDQTNESRSVGSTTGALGIPPNYPPAQPPKLPPVISDPEKPASKATMGTEQIATAPLKSVSEHGNNSELESLPVKPAGENAFHFTKLILCKRVDGFGQYEPVPSGYRFCPGAAGFPGERVLLYAEMSAPPGYSSGGTFRTFLSGEVEILSQTDRNAVCKLGFPGREDCSRTARKDHHLVYSFHVPPGLPPGTYTLRVNARDCSQKNPGSGKTPSETCQASAVVDFEVDVGRGQGEGTRDKVLPPVGGGKTE